MFRVALAGYTNAGKSSLINRLCDADVLSYDKLFATLDSTTRKFELPEGREITVTDTVGFIQKLPTTLVEAFKSTLDEITGAHLILTALSDNPVKAQVKFYQNEKANAMPSTRRSSKSALNRFPESRYSTSATC